MSHRAETAHRRYQTGERMMQRGLDTILHTASETATSVIYYLKEIGDLQALRKITEDVSTDPQVRNLAIEASRLVITARRTALNALGGVATEDKSS